jgi:class 3 adenylate cyclase/tetratricopeptide (TPR) repeat protein
MQQIADWLQKLGLGQYSQRFAENDIEIDVLSELTDQDFDRLGVSLGHRRRMIRAIRELGAEPVAAVAEAETPAPTTSEPATKESAERRQVTVLFSDLVGSTALSARMDPEDLREVISAYQKSVAETVQRFGGFVAKYMGDGVLVYFGYPQAHEDDGERAVRAGLELVAAVSQMKTHAPLQTRVGIATGLVVVGDLIGSGASQEQAIVGETPNLAARFQGIAEPNAVVIAESTRKLVGNLFELEDLGAQDLKGISGPVRAWTALRPSSVESRFEAMHVSGLTELVGREEELELLLRRWSKAKTGEGQVVLLSGEPGIGKSRLTAALLERIAAEAHTRLRYFCSPQHTDSPLYPIISQMERAAGLAHDDTTQAKLDKLDALLAQSSTPRPDAALLAEMLSLSNDGRYPALELAPQQKRQKTLEALTAQLEALSQSKPVLMIFEDVHWTDPTSLETLGRTVDRLRTLGVLLIITYRLEFEAPWIGRPYVTALNLNRLGEREIAEMIDRVTGNKPLAESVRQDIVERTDGIPLFVEEMTKAVLEAESEGDARKTAAAVPSSAIAVPASLHASLMARLDRLGPAKEVAQIGAVIGREFSHALLAAVALKKEKELQSALDALIRAGLLFRQGVPPTATYLFKHALVQDAAYGTLLREPRRALHGRIAETLESQFAEIADNQPELLARHSTEAGLIEKAAGLWAKAGQRSLERSALAEAVEQLRKGLALVEKLPEGAMRMQHELDLQIALGKAMIATKGYGALETGEAFNRARSLCEQLDHPPQLVSVLHGQWVRVLLAGDLALARSRAEELLTLGMERNDPIWTMMGCRISGVTCCWLGELIAARDNLERGLLLYDPAHHSSYAELTVDDTHVVMLSYLAWTLLCLGYLDQARAKREAALAEARLLSRAFTLAHALSRATHAEAITVGPSGALLHADEWVSLTERLGIGYYLAESMNFQGWCLAMLGQREKGLTQLTSGLAAYRAHGLLHVPTYLTLLADAYREVQQPQSGLRQLEEAISVIGRTQARYYEAEMHRVRGELFLSMHDDGAAEASFRKAINVAQHQSAKTWELRASMSLARLRRDQGKTLEARELLAPVYGWFTEGFDTRDLKEAKALLEQLS